MFAKRFRVASAMAALLACGTLAPGWAGDSPLSELKMAELIKKAEIVDATFPLRVLVDDKSVIVQTRRSAKASDNDCKIDALFLAKTLLDAYPNQIQKVNVLFHRDSDDTFNKVTVTPKIVEDFGAGIIDQPKLLGSLKITVDSAESETTDNA